MQGLRTWLLLAGLSLSTWAGAEPLIKSGDRVAITGDSITEQKLYSRYIETYLQACTGLQNVKVFQFGWGGDKAPGFANRMNHDAMFWKPTVATTCYGMNDGGYRPYDEKAIGVPYRDGMNKIVKTFKAAGVKVIVGTPGVVDSNSWRGGNGAAAYNDNLGQLGKIDAEIAQQQQTTLADLHTVMMDVMAKAKAANGPQYHVAGQDGVHPRPNGHLVMAYAFLKAMGFNGQIATIQMDMRDKTTASEGLKITQQCPGKVEIESSRYPFCFDFDAKNTKNPELNSSILPFLPFQQDLNRYELKVENLETPKAEVNWGGQKKVFTREDLEKGINLAAEFLNNPFSAQFAKISKAVGDKQNYETWMIKSYLTGMGPLEDEAKRDPKLRDSLQYTRSKVEKRQSDLDAQVKAAVTPVKFQLTVTPIK